MSLGVAIVAPAFHLHAEDKPVTVGLGSKVWVQFKTKSSGDDHLLSIHNGAKPCYGFQESHIDNEDKTDAYWWEKVPGGTSDLHEYKLTGVQMSTPLWVDIKGKFQKLEGVEGCGGEKGKPVKLDFEVHVPKALCPICRICDEAGVVIGNSPDGTVVEGPTYLVTPQMDGGVARINGSTVDDGELITICEYYPFTFEVEVYDDYDRRKTKKCDGDGNALPNEIPVLAGPVNWVQFGYVNPNIAGAYPITILWGDANSSGYAVDFPVFIQFTVNVVRNHNYELCAVNAAVCAWPCDLLSILWIGRRITLNTNPACAEWYTDIYTIWRAYILLKQADLLEQCAANNPCDESGPLWNPPSCFECITSAWTDLTPSSPAACPPAPLYKE